MKKFINGVDRMLAQSLDGFSAAYSDLVRLAPGYKFVARAQPAPRSKVAVISGGGAGHEPMHCGFVGFGMLDAACPGQVFTSPTPDQIVAAVEAVGGDAGVAFVVKNYEGDLMNFEIATESGDLPSGRIVVCDDVSVDMAESGIGRRGIAGTLVVDKMVGAAAERGDSLEQVLALGRRVSAHTRSIGVALSSCTAPAIGRPSLDLGSDEIEFGVGIHGEPGRRREPMASAEVIAEEMVEAVTVEFGRGDILMFINGFGATPNIELYTMYDEARRRLEHRGFSVRRSLVGSFVTSFDAAGCSLTITSLDDGFTEAWDAPVCTPALRWGM